MLPSTNSAQPTIAMLDQDGKVVYRAGQITSRS
jgi:hypothetical protein